MVGKTSLKSGRTIGERREHLETASERMASHKKIKRHQKLRLIFTILGFGVVLLAAICIGTQLFQHDEASPSFSSTIVVPYKPTVEVIDEDAATTGGRITSRMEEYIGQAEADFRELGYTPTKVIIPSNSIREVDFYLDGYNGFIKILIDRGTGVSVEDADRVIRYLAGIGVSNFSYIDVRLDGQAYWK